MMMIFQKKERLEKEVNFLDKHPEYSFVGTIANVFDKNKIWGTFRLPEKPQKKVIFYGIAHF